MSNFPEPIYAEIDIDAQYAQTGDDNDLYQNDERRQVLASKIREALRSVGVEVSVVSIDRWRL